MCPWVTALPHLLVAWLCTQTEAFFHGHFFLCVYFYMCAWVCVDQGMLVVDGEQPMGVASLLPFYHVSLGIELRLSDSMASSFTPV